MEGLRERSHSKTRRHLCEEPSKDVPASSTFVPLNAATVAASAAPCQPRSAVERVAHVVVAQSSLPCVWDILSRVEVWWVRACVVVVFVGN